MADNIQIKDASGTSKTVRTTDTTGSDLHVPIHRLDSVNVTGPSAQSVLNTDLLGGVVNGWYDASAFFSGTIQIVASSGISAGAIIFEQTNDNSTTTGIALPAQEVSVVNSNPIVAAVTIAASTRRAWQVSLTMKYIRVRISTAFTGGTVQAFAAFAQQPYAYPAVNVQQATAANLNATVSGTITNTPATPTQHFASAAASTNATSVKTSAGTIYGLQLTNLSATVAFFKLYRKASAPTVGTDVPDYVIRLAANSNTFVDCSALGIRMTTGIAYAITGGSGDTDTTAIGAAGDIRVSMEYI